MKKILVPTDFSLTSRWASEIALDIAKRSGAEVLLLHVVEQPIPQSFNVQGQIDESEGWEDKLYTFKLIEKGKLDLSNWTEAFSSPEVRVTQVMRIGNPYHAISNTIVNQNIDLVVMGTCGNSWLEKLLVGSTTDKVIRFSKCPVLTMNQKPSSKAYKNIVYATSMSDDEGAFGDIVKSTQGCYDAIVHLVRINTPSNFAPDTEIKKMLKRFANKIGLKNYTLNTFNDRTPEDGVIHFADSIEADLIVMATHGRSDFAHVLVGSVAEHVASHSQRPVLTYLTS